jgi:hypothetical protein
MRHALDRVESLPPERRVVFIKSWNEWAEGNYLEPDLRHGHAFLEAVKSELQVRNPQAVSAMRGPARGTDVRGVAVS